jgi:hypothetical protein
MLPGQLAIQLFDSLQEASFRLPFKAVLGKGLGGGLRTAEVSMNRADVLVKVFKICSPEPTVHAGQSAQVIDFNNVLAWALTMP